MQVHLKKLLSKKELLAVINEVIGAAGTPICVRDPEERLLAGVEINNPSHKYPVEHETETIGWVSGDCKASAIASLLSYQAGAEVQKKTLARETLEKYKEITLLYSIAEKITSCLNLKEVAKLVIDEANKFIGATGASVMLLEKDGGKLEIIAAFGSDYHPEKTINPGEGIRGDIFLTGRAEIVNDASSDPRYVEGSDKLASVICAPLRIKDSVIGVISLSSTVPVTYTAEHLKLLSTLASQAAAAIENARLYDELRETFFTTVHTLAETIEKRDPYTAGHTRRVMEYSLAIGEHLGLPEKEMTTLKLAAILHDIGKIGVRDSVLLKEGKLSDEEFDAIKMHPVYGEDILKHIQQMAEVIPGVKQHHEKYDGRGYPDRLKGPEIDITARIIAVADSFDAMTSDRPYRKGLSLDIAFEELRKHSGGQFDTDMVNAFFIAYENGKIVL